MEHQKLSLNSFILTFSSETWMTAFSPSKWKYLKHILFASWMLRFDSLHTSLSPEQKWCQLRHFHILQSNLFHGIKMRSYNSFRFPGRFNSIYTWHRLKFYCSVTPQPNSKGNSKPDAIPYSLYHPISGSVRDIYAHRLVTYLKLKTKINRINTQISNATSGLDLMGYNIIVTYSYFGDQNI